MPKQTLKRRADGRYQKPNLSQKIKETGIETGIEIGKKEMIVKMHSKGYTTAQIADVAGMEEKQIEEIIKNSELLPA